MVFLSAVLALSAVLLWRISFTGAVSANATLTSQTDWEAGEFWLNQLDTKTSAGDLAIKSGGVGSWDVSTPAFPEDVRGNFALGQEPADYGADLATDGTYLYMIPGGRQPDFFRYNPELNTWKQLKDAPTDFYVNGAITYYSGYLYAINGHDGNSTTDATGELWRYDIANDTWAKMASAPGIWGSLSVGGADIESGNDGKLYAVKGNAETAFWIYTIATNTWSDGPSVPDPVTAGNSHPIVYSDVSFVVGSDTHCSAGCIYTFLGNSRSFYRYDISFNQWYTGFADVPSALGNVALGSAMALDTVNDDIYALRGGATEFIKYDIGNPGTWDAATGTTENTQRATTAGASSIYLNGFVYATLGGVPEFVRFNVTTGQWNAILTQNAQGTNASGLIAFVPNGADCADSSGCLFVAQGGGTGLRRFDLSTRTWSAALTVIPAANGLGASLCYDGNNTIYIARGGNTTNVYPYSISGNSYDTTIAAPGAVQQGGSITCTANDRFYLLRGNAQNSFYYYNGTTLAADDNFPVPAVSYGGALANNGTYVYALAGNLRGNFYRFDPSQISGSRWSAMANLPTTSYYAATMEFDGTDNLYVVPSKYSTDFWRYDISANAWSRISDTPLRFGYSHGLSHDDTNGVLYVLRGAAPSTNAVSIHKFNTETDAYIPSATWISAPIDLNFVSSFTSFAATVTTPGTTSIAYQSRTSSDKVSWSAWANITGGAIGSAANRYIEIKVTLTSDNSNSPTLSAFTVTYERDSTAPTNPTATGYANASLATTITSGNTYYHANPTFVLAGAADAQSGLSGYYAAWTTNGSLDPTTSEDYFQTGTTYKVTSTLASGTTYYLRVATKDKAGNTASPVTLFTYIYNGISPAATKQWTSQADFSAAGTTLTSVTAAAAGSIALSSVTNGAWSSDAPLPVTVNNGAAIAFDGNDKLYILRGTSTQTFYSYTLSTKLYATLTNYGVNVTTGASMVFVPNGAACADAGGCLFATQGGTTTFKRYNINATTWDTLTVLSTLASSGSALAYDGSNTIYYMAGNGVTFYKYSISGNSWTQLPNIDQTIGLGGTLVWVPNGAYCTDATGCLFATRGANDTDFYRFRVTANNWSYMANTPIWIGDGASAYRLNQYIYLVRGVQSDVFLRYDIANNLWEYLAPLPASELYGSSTNLTYVSATNTFYVLRANTENTLLSYDVAGNTWKKTTTLPYYYTTNGFTSGVAAYDAASGLFYVGRGTVFTDWWSYNPSTDVWRQLLDVPHSLSTGADAEVIDHTTNALDGVYVLVGSEALGDNVGYFYRYSPASETWTRLTNAPGEPAAGADLVWDGTDALYTAKGGATTFYKYTISTDSWSTVVSTIPAANGSGSCAVKINVGGTDYIYLARANSQANVYRFNLGTQTWDAAATVESAPAVLVAGDACVLDGQGNILLPQGSTNTNFYVLDPDGDANGVWTTRTVLQTYSNGMLAMTANNVILGFRGLNTSAMDRYVVATASTGYAANGSWTSEIIDFGQGTYGFSGLAVTLASATNTTLSFQTRTCSDSGCASNPNDSDWGAWTDVSSSRSLSGTMQYSIDSTVARYGQARATFVSDQVFTPTVSDITWGYYTDGTAPTNPGTLTSLSQSGGTAITTGNWYNYAGPYFSWSGASDNSGGIGIEGYCVYFGTNASADPASGCTPQTATTYTASGLSTATTYYLRIKTRDWAGNVSATAWSAFTYSYDSVAPSRPTNLQANPAVPSATNNFAFSWTAGSDSGGSPSFQYCYKRYFSAGNQDATETCVASSTTTLSGIAALAEGTSYLYVRSKDAAGNYSNSGEYESVAYRWAQTPPTLPQSVASGTVENDPYQHTFSWNAPASSAFTITAYCFQINVQPTAAYCNNGTYGRWTTSAETSARFLAAFNTPNTQQGTNYFYIVAKDEAGNVDYNPTYNCASNLGCATFTSTTISPNPPQNIAITDASDRAAGTYRLTLGWRKSADNPGSQLSQYRVYRSTNGADFTVRETINNVSGQSDYAYTDVALVNTVTYYYYVKAVDSAGAESAATLTVSKRPEGKFTSPPNLIGNPSIQPRIRSAVIQWLTDEPDTHAASSFIRYGTASGQYDGEQGSSELTGSHSVTLIDLAPATTYYFKLKWVDVDGNIGQSPEYTFSTNDAPSAPVNLAVSPASNTTNRFTFDWDLPADEGVTVSGYFYSINDVPTESDSSFVTTSTVGPIAAATQQGVNTFYVVAVDDFGNVNYNNYASVQFEVNTAAPSPPRNVTIVDSSDRDAQRYNITLTWDAPTTTAAGDALAATHDGDLHYTIYRSTNGGQEFSSIAEIQSTGYLDTGLDNTKTYTYKVVASDTAGATSESTPPVAEVPEGRYTRPPAVIEGPTAAPDSFSAVVTWRTERVASSFVVFGLAQDALTEEQGQAEQVESHTVKVTGLEPETTYSYQIKSIDVDENAALSETKSFTTLEAPKVSELVIKDVRLNDALITWETNKDSTTVVLYGTTPSYGASFTDLSGSFSATHTIKLENLADGTLYHVRVLSEDRNGNPVVSDDYVFTTLTFPKVSDVAAKNQSAGQTEITWKTNVPTTSSVEYYGDTIPPKTQGNTALVTDHVVLLYGLEDATLYKYKVRGSDQFGYEAISAENEFTTMEDTTPPEVFGTKSESNTIGSGEQSKIQIIVSWKSNEPATSKVEFGVGLAGDQFTDTTDENAELVMDHLIVIPELAPAKTYHFRVVSRDKAGNETKSTSYTVLTSRRRESFLQLIISNLEESFSWMGNIGSLFGRKQ